jgi:hypothetical protein
MTSPRHQVILLPSILSRTANDKNAENKLEQSILFPPIHPHPKMNNTAQDVEERYQLQEAKASRALASCLQTALLVAHGFTTRSSRRKMRSLESGCCSTLSMVVLTASRNIQVTVKKTQKSQKALDCTLLGIENG